MINSHKVIYYISEMFLSGFQSIEIRLELNLDCVILSYWTLSVGCCELSLFLRIIWIWFMTLPLGRTIGSTFLIIGWSLGAKEVPIVPDWVATIKNTVAIKTGIHQNLVGRKGIMILKEFIDVGPPLVWLFQIMNVFVS